MAAFDPIRVTVEGLEEGKERGRGCYGAVYEVRLNGLPCIAKRLHDILVGRGKEEPVSIAERNATTERFREECVLLSRLHHPNIVQFMGVHYGRDEADINLIMEYMHMDLDQCMKTYHILLPYKTSILRDVAYGLAYLHSIPIIHRDLNAGNVLLTESLRAKIADLGVAKLFDQDEAVHVQLTKTRCPGAMAFMSPESLSRSPKYSKKLDVFSFGHLTVYLVNQEAPYVDEQTITIEDFHNEQKQVGKRRWSLNQMGGPGHPLYSIAVQCLSDTPDQRPTSRDLVRRMEELCENQPIPYRNTLQTMNELVTKNCEQAELIRANEAIAIQLKAQKDKVEAIQDELIVLRLENNVSEYKSTIMNLEKENRTLEDSIKEFREQLKMIEQKQSPGTVTRETDTPETVTPRTDTLGIVTPGTDTLKVKTGTPRTIIPRRTGTPITITTRTGTSLKTGTPLRTDTPYTLLKTGTPKTVTLDIPETVSPRTVTPEIVSPRIVTPETVSPRTVTQRSFVNTADVSTVIAQEIRHRQAQGKKEHSAADRLENESGSVTQQDRDVHISVKVAAFFVLCLFFFSFILL